MKQNRIIAVLLILLVLFSPVLFRKYHVSLASNNKIVAVATRPLVFPWNDNKFSVYVGNDKAFSVWADFFDFPMFIYPFADGKRFLCDYDDDTAILVFVVDFNEPAIKPPNSTDWPYAINNFLLSQRMTNVVMETKGLVRFPNCAELQEVSSYLRSLSSSQLKTCSFPTCDFGAYRIYVAKEFLLADIATNRTSDWPIPR